MAQCENENQDTPAITGYAHLTLTAKVVSHQDFDDCLPPDTIRHQFTSTIVDNSLGKVHTPDRVWSPGFALGMELARLGKSLRYHFADWEDVVDGFAYEMEDE